MNTENKTILLDESKFLDFMTKIEENFIKEAEKELKNEKYATKQCEK